MKKHAGEVIIAPRITEKASFLSEGGVYAFDVMPNATKKSVADAIREIYKISPRKVTLIALPRKKVQTRGTNRTGITTGGKKAYVFLKQGDKIELA